MRWSREQSERLAFNSLGLGVASLAKRVALLRVRVATVPRRARLLLLLLALVLAVPLLVGLMPLRLVPQLTITEGGGCLTRLARGGSERTLPKVSLGILTSGGTSLRV